MSVITEMSGRINYSGTVHIKKLNTKVKSIIEEFTVKNNGTKYLFRYLCESLRGGLNQYIPPRYIDATSSSPTITEENIPENLTSALTYRSHLSNTEVVSKDNSYEAIFSAIITASQLQVGAEIAGLVLYPESSLSAISTPFAVIGLDSPIALESQEVLLIEWRLSFSNQVEI